MLSGPVALLGDLKPHVRGGRGSSSSRAAAVCKASARFLENMHISVESQGLTQNLLRSSFESLFRLMVEL